MSNRYSQNRNNDYRNSPKPQQKFIPKRDSQNPNSQQTLSNSIRAAGSTSSAVAGGGVESTASPTSRVKIGGNGELVNRISPNGNFVIYLPQDEAVAAGLGPEEGGLDPVESQRVVDLLNRELSRLLKSNPRDFWREVATDESLRAFLESFLKFRTRWFDFPYRGARGTVAGVIVGEIELCRRVFMVLYRLSSNRDPGAKAADTLSQKDHAALLQDKRFLDLPKLLDICAIYGQENEDLTRILVMNAMNAQPSIQDEFPVLMSHFLSIVQTMYQRCTSTLEVLLGSGGSQDQGSKRLCDDYLEVMDFINDAVVSMDSFVNAHKQAAIFFSSPVEISYGNDELLSILAKLHDSLLPSFHKGFNILFTKVENKTSEISSDLLSNIFISLKMLSTRIVKFGWKLLYFCYLNDEAFESNSYSVPGLTRMFPANVEDPLVRSHIIIQSIRDLSGDYMQIPEGRTFIQNIEKNHKLISRIELLRKMGWISMEDEQFQFLSIITNHPPETNTKTPITSAPPRVAHTDENAAILESKISQIKELFPDYGTGFLLVCLEAYNHDTEEVIQRILEGTLHEEINALDRSLDKIPPQKTAMPVNKHDKGKGKLIDPEIPLPEITVTSLPMVSSSSSTGRFIRKNNDDSSSFGILDAKKDKEMTKTAALASQLEYEDEYDDSFDDLGLSVGDSGLDESEEKMRGRSNESNGGGGSSTNPDNSKWGSRKKPQFYVKDGKNYSYKVDGSVAVANYNEARIVTQSQKEQVHGLGRGGNVPFGRGKMVNESNEEKNDGMVNDEVVGRGRVYGRGGGGGRRGFHSGPTYKRVNESNEEQNDGQDSEEGGGRGGNLRGRGRSRGGRSNHRHRGMNKHLSGMPGHYSHV